MIKCRNTPLIYGILGKVSQTVLSEIREAIISIMKKDVTLKQKLGYWPADRYPNRQIDVKPVFMNSESDPNYCLIEVDVGEIGEAFDEPPNPKVDPTEQSKKLAEKIADTLRGILKGEYDVHCRVSYRTREDQHVGYSPYDGRVVTESYHTAEVFLNKE